MLRRLLACSIYICYCAGLLAPVHIHAQTNSPDTLELNIQQAEKIFLEKNLQLLAQQYNVEASKALIQQAKLWENPMLNTDQNVYSNNQFFEHGTDANGQPYGQYFVQLQQLIKTAGKRGKEIKMARTNAEISDWQLKDLLRNLRMQLHADYYTLVQLQHIRELYADGKQQLNKLLEGMQAQYKAGNIAQKDLLRVQALAIGLQQDMADNEKQLNETEAELKTMLQVSGNTYIKVDGNATPFAMPDKSITELNALAKESNPYYQLQQLQLKYQQQNLSLQKAIAVPDVTVGPNFDKNSNYTPNYFGMGISLPLPLLNRNQGNIKAAKWQVKSSEATTSYAEQELGNNVLKAYNTLATTLQLRSATQSDFYDDYSKLYNNVVNSYRQRQISLIEFIDFFDTYKEMREKQLQLELNLQLAKEELNYQVGNTILP